MATITGLNIFTAGTPAKSSEVNNNFNIVKTFAEGLSTGANLDAGSVSATKIAANAITSDKIVNNTIVLEDLAVSLQRFLVPVGSISAYAGAAAPTGWLLCDGTSTTGYTALAALVGATTPDMRGRFALGDNASLTLLGTGGSTSILEANLPSHTHTFSGTTNPENRSHTHSVSLSDSGHNHLQDPHSHTTQATISASSGAHDNTVNYVAAGTNAASTTPSIASISSTTATNQSSLSGVSVSSVGNASQDHNHPFSGTTAGGAGTGAAYYQPHLVVNYIIKHD